MSITIANSYTTEFLDLTGECSDKTGAINLKTTTREKLKRLASCSENVVSENINNIGAIGDLLYWSQQLDEPPHECTAQIGLLLRSLSNLLSRADFIKDNAYHQLNQSNK